MRRLNFIIVMKLCILYSEMKVMMHRSFLNHEGLTCHYHKLLEAGKAPDLLT